MSCSNNYNHRRLYYGEEKLQFGDLRTPKGQGQFPIVIVIHGGFWKSLFTFDMTEQLAIDLTNRGYATWNVEFRRVGDQGGGYPGTMEDIVQATNFLKTVAKEYNLDLKNIIALGHSAGGQLALWLAHYQNKFDNETKYDSNPLPIQAVVSLAGITDLKLMWKLDNYFHKIVKNVEKGNAVEELLGGTPTEVGERYNETSPVSLLPLGIPQLLIHGDLDLNVPIKFSELYYTLAKSMGDKVKMLTFSDVEHFEIIDPSSDVWLSISHEIDLLLNLIKNNKADRER